MSRIGTLMMLVVLLNIKCVAQEASVKAHHHPVQIRQAAKTTIISSAEENYDVKYLKFNLDLTNTTTTLTGDVITTAQVVADSLPVYVFELTPPLVIDSVLVNGVNQPYTTSGDARSVVLPAALPNGAMFTTHIYYHGTPASAGSAIGTVDGINAMSSPSWGTKVLFTLSESYHAKEWWPCKQSLHDKIDSVDMWITVGDTLKAGSNGLLQAVTPVDANHVRYEWKERNPIDYYLISVAVAPYVDYSYYMHYTGSTDSTLVQNYVYNNPATLPYFKSVIDSTGMMIDYLSTLYGRYPFWQEKYGHCMAPLSGGMEHETMTTLGFFEGSLIVHELGHQWFGDNVTCGTWADIVMNEGFASYTEDIFRDHFHSHTDMLQDMRTKQNDVKSSAGGTVFVDDTTSEDRIFDERLTYDKGACVLHMLRFVINNDSEFFQVYRNYQQALKNTTGTITDFKNTTESMLGTTINSINIDTFFDQWMYREGYPEYTIHWNQVGSDVYVQLDQATAVPSSVACFTIPMEIKLHSAAGDTIVRIVNNAPSQLYHFTWSKAALSVVTDPDYWLVYSVLSNTKDPLLSVSNVSMPVVSIHPNPAATYWLADGVASGNTLALTDISGRTLWQGIAAGSTVSIPAAALAPGLYMLSIKDKGQTLQTVKLVRQ